MRAEKIIRLRIQNSTFCRRIRVVQGDTGRIFRFILEDITMDGSEQARVYAKKPDGTEVYNDCEVVSPNEVLMESDSGQIFAAIGVVQAEIQISKSGKTITTYTFEFDVEKSLTRAGAIQSSSEYGALETAIAKAEGFYNPTFSEAATRNNINSGESIPTLFGKVKKWFTDLNTLIKLVGSADISSIGNGTVTGALLTLNSKLFFGTFPLGKSYTFNIEIAATFIFIRTNQPVEYTGIITIDQFGCNGSVTAIDVKVENKKVTITNTDSTLRYCIGIIQ